MDMQGRDQRRDQRPVGQGEEELGADARVRAREGSGAGHRKRDQFHLLYRMRRGVWKSVLAERVLQR